MATGITEQDVFETADLLLARGDRPTIKRIRLELGRGSPNTVNRHLDCWWATLSKRMAGKSDAENLPAALAELCSKLYDGIREHAGRDAQQKLAPDRESLALDRQRLEAERQALIHERSNVSALIETLRADLTKVSAQNSTSAARIAALEVSLRAEQTRADEAEARIPVLVADAVRDRDLAAREIERIHKQSEANESRWRADMAELRSTTKRVATDKDKELKLLRAAAGTSKKQRDNLDAQLAKHQGRFTKTELNLAREREARIAAESELVGLRRTVDRQTARAGLPARTSQKKPRSAR